MNALAFTGDQILGFILIATAVILIAIKWEKL